MPGAEVQGVSSVSLIPDDTPMMMMMMMMMMMTIDCRSVAMILKHIFPETIQ